MEETLILTIMIGQFRGSHLGERGEDPYLVPVNATFLGQSLRRIAWEYPDYCY